MKDKRLLLKQLKKAYKFYIEEDVVAFDETLASIVLSFSSDLQRVLKKIKEVINYE